MHSAAVFPGQGSQKAGMARGFHAEFPAARLVFEEVSDALGEDMAALCFTDDPRLHLTAHTQPAILTAEIAMYRALVEAGLSVQRFGGHSLGEYTALVAAGVIPLAEAARLVRARGEAMQRAVPVGQGAMAALIGESLDEQGIASSLAGLQVDVANLNSPEQVVISGAAADIDAAQAILQAAVPGLRVRRLAVSAPFHSRLMRPIEDDFRALLEASSARWSPAGAAAVLCNFTGTYYPDMDQPGPLIDGLTRQISGTVRWVDNMRALTHVAHERGLIYEIGPRRPLRGFFRALGVSVTAITNLTSARRALGA